MLSSIHKVKGNHMTKRIAVTNNKGGVGKTTVATSLSRHLARSKKTLLIDLDPQRNATNALSGLNNEDEFELNVCDIFEKEVNKIPDISPGIQTYIEKGEEVDTLHYFPSSLRLSAVEDNSLTHALRAQKLTRALKKIEKHYDYIILDLPPSTGTILHNAAVYADVFICPVTTDKASIDGIATTVAAIEQLKADEFELLILRNMVDAREKRLNRERDIKLAETPLIGDLNCMDATLKTTIRVCAKFKEVQSNKSGLLHGFAKGENVMNDLSSLVKELDEIEE